MAKTTPVHRIVVHLDPRITLEAIIVNQLERVPTTRRQEWLRSLLVQGFRSECRTLRSVPAQNVRQPVRAFTQWLAKDAQRAVVSKEEPPSLSTRLPQNQTAGKPFAALRKVIG